MSSRSSSPNASSNPRLEGLARLFPEARTQVTSAWWFLAAVVGIVLSVSCSSVTSDASRRPTGGAGVTTPATWMRCGGSHRRPGHGDTARRTGHDRVERHRSADLVAALGELAEIQAAQTADTGTYKYKYADLAQIMSTVRPILARHNLAVTQLVSSTHEGELLVRTVLLHASGESFDMDPLGAKMPVTPQQVGSFISYFRRYQLTGRLGLAVEDDDGQAASKAPKAPAKKASQDPQTAKAMALFRRVGDRRPEATFAVDVAHREAGSGVVERP